MSDINEYPFNVDTPKADEYLTDEAIPEYSETTPNPSMSFDNTEDISLKSDYSFKGCNIEFSNSMSLFLVKNDQSYVEYDQNDQKDYILPSPIGATILKDQELEQENFACPQVVASETPNEPPNVEGRAIPTPNPNEELSTETNFVKDTCQINNNPPPTVIKEETITNTQEPTITLVMKYQNNSRKYKPDSIRKKIKSRSLKKIKNILNSKIISAGGNTTFDYFPQVFVSNVKIDCNKKALLLSLRDLYMKDFGGLPKDREKLRNNRNVIKYLDEHPLVKKKGGIDLLLLFPFKKILLDYFYSKEFNKDLEKLHNEGEDDEYVNKYKYLAYNWVEFYENDGKILGF